MMAAIDVKRFEQADETRPFKAHGHVELVRIGGREIGKGVFEPGWRWSTDVKPIAGTESCEFPHLLYVLSGSMRIVMDDGTEREIGPGDVAAVPPGHDAEVVGEDACIVIDLADEDADYAKRG